MKIFGNSNMREAVQRDMESGLGRCVWRSVKVELTKPTHSCAWGNEHGGWTSPGLSGYKVTVPPLSSYLLTGGAVSSSGDTEVGRRERGTRG